MASIVAGTPTGFEGNLTEQQMEALNELRERIMNGPFVEDFKFDEGGDRFLLRFLRASMKDKSGKRVFNTDAAEARLISTFKFRREVGYAELKANFESTRTGPEKYDLYTRLYPGLNIINNTTGQLVRFQRFGKFIANTDMTLLTQMEWGKCFTFESLTLQQELRAQSLKHGREISTYAVVTDLQGMSLWGVASRLSYIKFMSSFASDHFPEMMGQTIAIRGPSFLPAVFNLVKPFIDKDVQSKFHLSNEVPKDLISALLPLDEVPKEYGGTSDVVVPAQISH